MEHADPALCDVCRQFKLIGMGKLGGAIRYFRRAGVSQVVMAGKFHKVLLYDPRLWWRHLPDWQFIIRFSPYLFSIRRDRKDDSLLLGLVREFARDGLHFVPATDYLPELLVSAGLLTRAGLHSAQRRDVEFGWELAKEMGRLDVGQSVAVKDRAVLAVEAIEGTDECIRRAGSLCRSGGFTVVKVAKPRQDMRFDVPTIGVRTLQTMVAAGARVLAIEAEKTILLDREEVLSFANRHGLTIVAVQPNRSSESVPPAPHLMSSFQNAPVQDVTTSETQRLTRER
jgi:hypothetical protein